MLRTGLIAFIALAISFVTIGCEAPPPDEELKKFCGIVKAVVKEKKELSKQKIAVFVRTGKDLSNKEVVDLLLGLDKVPPKKRYKALKKGAKKLGVKKYKCSAAKKWFKKLKD